MTPAERPNLDDATFNVMRERSRSGYGANDLKLRRRSSQQAGSGVGPSVVLALAARAGLLFALGVGYGLLVTRLQGNRDLGLAASFGVEGLVPTGGYDWRYLLFWGVAGVALGGLLPWFDGVWEESFGKLDGQVALAAARTDGNASPERDPETDWALVMRGIGAFVGIVFAIVSVPLDFTPLMPEINAGRPMTNSPATA